MTQPTEGDIWKMCDTEAGSISLSCIMGQRCLARQGGVDGSSPNDVLGPSFATG